MPTIVILKTTKRKKKRKEYFSIEGGLGGGKGLFLLPWDIHGHFYRVPILVYMLCVDGRMLGVQTDLQTNERVEVEFEFNTG